MGLNHRPSSGREPYVFRVDSPCDLFGFHVWGRRRWRRAPVCLSSLGYIIGTDSGFIRIVEEPSIKPEVLNFAVSTCCIPGKAVKKVAIHQQETTGLILTFLHLEIGHDSAVSFLNIPVDEESQELARQSLILKSFEHSAGRQDEFRRSTRGRS